MAQSLQEIKDAYQTENGIPEGSSKLKEIEDLLKPVAAQITRIVAVGVGIPSDLNQGTLEQLGMLNLMRHVIEQDPNGQDSINVYYSELSLQGDLDREFLMDFCEFQIVDYQETREGEEEEEDADVPEYIQIRVADANYWFPSSDSKVSNIAGKIDDSTLLFMPNPPFRPFLKIIARTRPLMVIGNTIQQLCKATHAYEMAIADDATRFRQEWDEEVAACIQLRDKYWKQDTNFKFMAYSRTLRTGWKQETVDVHRMDLARSWQDEVGGEDGFHAVLEAETLTQYLLRRQNN